MLIDLRDVSEDELPATDVCIVGAGAAGITLALELSAAGRDVVLLESGGLEFERSTQDLYSGESVHPSFADLDTTRLRFLGGSTNHWNGRCPLLSPIDFEARDWVPESGWPIKLDELYPYYERACPYLEIPRFAHRSDDWPRSDWPDLDFSEEVITRQIALRSRPPTRFGEVYRPALEDAGHIRTYLHANCVGIDTNDDGSSVRRLQVATLHGKRVTVAARRFVLAAGGIEVPRLLLQPHRTNANGLGQTHDLVGRYFSDHIGLQSGTVLFSSWEDGLRYLVDNNPAMEPRISRFLGISPEVQRRERLLHCAFRLQLIDEPDSPMVSSLKTMQEALRARQWPDNFGHHVGQVIRNVDELVQLGWNRLRGTRPRPALLRFYSELPPLADSRISLLPERDALGLYRVRLDWRVPAELHHTFNRAHELLAQEFGRQGLGRLQLFEGVDEDLEGTLTNNHHHMGATRMHHDPKKGVVNVDCRVHGISNLYVAGSAVYPSYGHANPTLTIVALTIRLADHLANHPA